MDTADVRNLSGGAVSTLRRGLPAACLSVILVFALILGTAGNARADIVRMNNGREISVDSCRFEGDNVILVFRCGGEVKAPKDMVAEVLPDEVPHAMAFALEALAASASASGP